MITITTGDKAKLGNIYTEEAYALIKRLEFRNMLSRFRVDAPANEKIEKIFQMVEDFGEADQVLTKAAAVPRLPFAVHQEEGQVLSLSLTLSEKETYVIPVEGFVTADWLLGRLGEAFAHVPEITTLKLKEALKCLSAHGVTIEKERQGRVSGRGNCGLSAESAEGQLHLRRTSKGIRESYDSVPGGCFLVRIN